MCDLCFTWCGGAVVHFVAAVSTVIFSITAIQHSYAFTVRNTTKFIWSTWSCSYRNSAAISPSDHNTTNSDTLSVLTAIVFVRIIKAMIYTVTFERAKNAVPIVTHKLAQTATCAACMKWNHNVVTGGVCKTLTTASFVRTIATVLIIVTFVSQGNRLLGGVTNEILLHHRYTRK